jgi:subtilisin family serine protease
VKVLDDSSFSGRFFFFSEIVAALDHLIVNQGELDVRVVNMSLGTDLLFAGVCDGTTAFNIAGSQAVNILRGQGVIAFASSMNNSSSTQMASPACLENVVAVGAVAANDLIPSFSNGNAATDLLAPGVQINSLAPGGSLRTASGTSMASPHAAGCAALLIQEDPALTPESLAAELRQSSVEVTDPRNGLSFPRLDCQARVAPVEVAVSIDVSDSEPRMGDPVELLATVTNLEDEAVPDVTVAIGFPAERLEFESATASRGHFAENSGIWEIGTLEAGEAVTLLVRAVVRILEPEAVP